MTQERANTADKPKRTPVKQPGKRGGKVPTSEPAQGLQPPATVAVVDPDAEVVYEHPERVVYLSDTWGAVYFQGNVRQVGDRERVLLWLIQDHGYHLREGEGFRLPRNGGFRVAQTLDEIDEHLRAEEARETRARDLREQAAALLAAADELTPARTKAIFRPCTDEEPHAGHTWDQDQGSAIYTCEGLS